MSFVLIAAVLTLIVIFFTLSVRSQDVPEAAPVSPTQHLEARKAAIYENLRDLQFEYRVGKLSDHDYQRTKTDMQAELATVLAEIDRLQQKPAKATAVAPPETAQVCPHCNAKFDKALKFCGECGKAMVHTA